MFRRLLLVEDMADLARIMAECLEMLGFEVEVAHTGEAALRLLGCGVFQVALVDIDLPDTSGFEIVSKARAAGWLSATQVVFCTGRSSGEYRDRAAGFPGCGFLRKPFTLQQLEQYVQELSISSTSTVADGTSACRIA